MAARGGKTRRRKGWDGRRNIAVIVAALGIVALSVITTLWFSVDFNAQPQSGQLRYRELGLDEAHQLCERYAKTEMGARLRVISLDSHSSRTDRTIGRHRMFFNAELYADKRRQGPTNEYFIACAVRLNRPVVASFTVTKNEDYKPKVHRKSGGGVFGG